MGESIHETADAIQGKVEHAKAKLLDGITSAVRSLSEAVAAKCTSEHATSSKTETKAETKAKPKTASATATATSGAKS